MRATCFIATCLMLAISSPAMAGLISYYPLDTDYTDAVGTNDGTGVGGVTIDATNSQIGVGSASFDGTDDLINLGKGALAITGDQLTLSAWIYYTGTEQKGGIIGKTNIGDNAYMMNIHNSGTVWTGIQTANAWTPSADGNTITGSLWIHVAMVYDGTSITRYLNGVQTGTTTAQSGNIRNSGADAVIGNAGDTITYFFKGNIDDVAVWDEALSQASITGLANGTLSPMDISAPTVPEPSSLALLAMGLLTSVLVIRRR